MSQGGNDGRDGAGPKAEDDVLASIRRIVGEEGGREGDAPSTPSARRPGGGGAQGDAPFAPATGSGAGSDPDAGRYVGPDFGSGPAERRDGVLPLDRAMRIEAGERGRPVDGDEGDDDAPLMLSARMRADGGPFPTSETVAPQPESGSGDAGPPASSRTDGDAPADAEASDDPSGFDPDAARGTNDAGGDDGAAASDAVRSQAPSYSGATSASGPVSGQTPPAATPPAAKPSEPTPSGRDLRHAMASDATSRVGPDGLPRDGEALEAMIRRILREELSGEMGERVSRNIKMLVEREVRRAVEQLAAEADAQD